MNESTAILNPETPQSDTRLPALRVLALSLVFPNAGEPGLGGFVRARLQHLNGSAEVKVIAPVAVTDYGARRLRWIPAAESHCTDSGMEVFHPGWAFPPGGTPLNVALLLARITPLVARLRRRFPFDLIDAHFGYPEGVVAAHLARIFGCPFTITLRGSEPVFAGYRFRRRCMSWALKRAAAVIAVSENLRQFGIRLGADPSRAVTIPNGIDASTYHSRDRAACRAKFGISPEARIIVSAGELIEAKGHHLVVRAISDLARQGLSAELFIAGGVARGGRRFDAELKETISSLGLTAKVHLAGWLPPAELACLISAADVFCLASYSEGWPNVVNEALACGCPVVGSDVGAMRDMVCGKQFGYVVPPRDQDALTRALGASLCQPWNRPGIAAWGQSRSWDDVAGEVLRLMRGLAPDSYVRN